MKKGAKKHYRIRFWAVLILVIVIIIGEVVYQNKKSEPAAPVTGVVEKTTIHAVGNFVLEGMSKVSIVQSGRSNAEEISDKEVEGMVKEAIDLAGGLRGIVRDGDTVVLKPNLVLMQENNKPDSPALPVEVNGVTTDWRVTRAVVKMVRKLNPSGKVYVMECTALESTRRVMEHFGYAPQWIHGVDEFIALENSVGKWKDTDSSQLVKVILTNGLLHKEYYLSKVYFEADVLISLPTLKNHSSAVMTGALKNVGIGATPPNIYGMSKNNILKFSMVNHFSDDLHKWIRDYNLCRRVNFVVMDGLQGLQNGPTHTDGPLSNSQMNMRLILASRDPVALDTIEALVAGWDPSSINYLKYLGRDKAGNNDVRRIEVIGKRVDEVRKIFDGMNPMAGGRKVFDLTPPEINQVSTSVSNGDLYLSLETEKKSVKAEVFLDGKLLEPVTTNRFDAIAYKNAIRSEGGHQLVIRVYDQYLNQSEIQTEVK